MSKENKPKGKIRVFLFELEGSDETLLESVRNISGAVNRTFNNTPRVMTKALVSSNKGDETEIPPAEMDLQEIVEEVSENGHESVPSSSSKPRRARRYATPQIVENLDLKSGDSPFKPFCEKKNPDNDTLKYLVIATWLKDKREIKEITINHIYTCYRLMGWTHPEEMGRVFQNAKGKGYFSKGSSKNSWVITHIGENRVTERNESN